jgi:hypothetical protein
MILEVKQNVDKLAYIILRVSGGFPVIPPVVEDW